MDKFVNNVVNKDKFKSTNKLWNDLNLNSVWSVGFTSEIVKAKKFEDKQEWYNFYFNSGEERLKEISKLPILEQNILQSTKPNYKSKHSNMNTMYGRTKLEIAKKGDILYEQLLKIGNPNNLSRKECQFIAYFRVVCETWNGIIFRENNTKENLEKYFKTQGFPIILIDTTGYFDASYGVDFEVYYSGMLICGIQIKPLSYLNNKDYLDDSKNINKNKNNKYLKEFNRNVYYIYASEKGYIKNTKVLGHIFKELKAKTKYR